jgi:hypothetical protein
MELIASGEADKPKFDERATFGELLWIVNVASDADRMTR